MPLLAIAVVSLPPVGGITLLGFNEFLLGRVIASRDTLKTELMLSAVVNPCSTWVGNATAKGGIKARQFRTLWKGRDCLLSLSVTDGISGLASIHGVPTSSNGFKSMLMGYKGKALALVSLSSLLQSCRLGSRRVEGNLDELM